MPIKKYRVETDKGNFDIEVDEGGPSAPFDINASREQLAKANTNYEANPPQMEHPGSQWTREKMGQRAIAGAKGELEGAAGGLVGLASLPVAAYTALRHPIETAKAAGTAVVVGGLALKRAYDQPGQTLADVGHATARWAADPEHIGQAAGALDVALASKPMLRAASSSLPGRMIKAGLSDVAENTKGLKAMKRVYEASRELPSPPVFSGRIMAAPAEAMTAPTPSAIDPATLARLTKEGYSPDVIAKIDAAAGGSGVSAPQIADVTAARRQMGADKLGRMMFPSDPSAVATGNVLRADPSGAGSAMPDVGQAALLRDMSSGTSQHPEMFQRAIAQVLKEYDRNQGVANSPVATDVAKRIRDLLIERLKGTD